MEESRGPSSSDVGAVNANLRAQPSESTDESHPANLECSGTEYRKREEELKGELEKSINDGRSKTAYIQELLNENKELRDLEAGTKLQLKRKEKELKFAQDETDVAKAKCEELEETITYLEDFCWSIVKIKNDAIGEAKAKCEELEETITSIVEDKNDAIGEAKAKCKELEKTKTDLEDTLDFCWSIFDDKNVAIGEAKAKCKELEETITYLEDTLDFCWSKLDDKNDAIGEAKAKCKELEERNTKLQKDVDLYGLVIDGKGFADGEQQCYETVFPIASSELDGPQQLKEGSLSQECTSDEEQKCHLFNRLKCPVSCVPTVFFNILEESGDEICDITLTKEVQRQLNAKRQPDAKPSEIVLKTCNYYHEELIELGLIVKVFSKRNIHSEDERKEALEEAFKKMEDEDARGLLLVCKKDDIGHCVQITPKRFQSASAGKTDFFDVQKNKPWPECSKNFNTIHTLIVFKINKDMLEVFKGPCGHRNCLLAKHRALSAKQLVE